MSSASCIRCQTVVTVVCPRLLQPETGDKVLRVIGDWTCVEDSRRPAERENGVPRQLGRLDLVRHNILEFAMLASDDEVVFGSHNQL